VNGLGNVEEDTIEVVDAEPANIFDRSSIRAAARFKFQPRVVDGQGVDVAGVQYLFRYQLED
jgi:protein TonB